MSLDYYGYRKKFALLVPSTNTAVEVEYNKMKPEGVVLATRGCVIPAFKVTNEDEFVGMVKAIGDATAQGLRDALTCRPDHVIFGYSAETFWDGKERSDREFAKYNDIAKQEGHCQITFGAQAIMDALKCYPGVKRIGVVTPYMPVGDNMVVKFLGDIGYDVVRIAGHSSPGPVEIAHESFGKTRQLVKDVDGDDVDLILQAGTNLYFVELAAQLEKELGKPVLAINALTFWHALRSNGIPDKIYGFGSLLEEHTSIPQ
ncbi:arylmalonate decarboxylase [Thalassotalea sp. HSM 43]|uniref:maleate cis-trans isomerase family protein n=1 Tax=Thalassotalea sp. HSM 43 TaxID=2552945 RepID=UPI001081CFF3|nr:arylmalonate decarboxylase [Thalassotalea sp. HSM 43]QBY04534.1 arylmalonate decarboxylase [Thalassotalea sp. HSM 43]